MLVLSRKKDEAIRIGDEITIKVIALKGGGVRLGIDAPSDIAIVRSELIPGVEICGESAVGHSSRSDSSDERMSFAEGI